MSRTKMSSRLEDVGVEAAKVRAGKKVHRAAPGQMSGCGLALSNLWDNSSRVPEGVTCTRRGCRRTDADRESFVARIFSQNSDGRKWAIAVGLEPNPRESRYARAGWREAVDAKMNKARIK